MSETVAEAQTVRSRVAAGVAYLDAAEPGWWKRIDLDRLDLHSCENCILGQLYEEDAEDFDAALGFDATPEDRRTFGYWRHSRAYLDVAREWKRVIAERRVTS